MSPLVANTRAELADALKAVRQAGGQVAFVPTMGALHSGHASLMRTAAHSGADAVVVSIFVNPTQFAPGEDLSRYPRTFDADLEMCASEGVGVVFAPDVDEVYPGLDSVLVPRTGSTTGDRRSSRGGPPGAEPSRDQPDGPSVVTVDPGPLGSVLEGVTRPTHFAGVLTVVAKLFGLVRPDVAVFGEKDYQQLTLIRAMVRDLCLDIDVVGAPTVREEDGLALSSRNRYLDAEQRILALALSRALTAGIAAAPRGAAAVRREARAVLDAEPAVELDYLELVSPDLGPAPESGEARLLVAAKVGTTRLIDNTGLDLGIDPGVDPTESRTT